MKPSIYGKEINVRSIITGSSGFIGQSLCRRLERLGHEVIKQPHGRHSVPDKFDYFFHLATYGNHYLQQDDAEIYAANVQLLWDYLQITNSVSYKMFVNFSTSSVNLPYQTIYSATKAAGEKLCQGFRNKWGKVILSIRPSSVYGEKEADFRFIPSVIRMSLVGNKIKLDPSPRHDWIYIDDFIDALLLITDKTKRMPNIIEIGTGKSYSNLGVIEIISEIMKEDNSLEYKKVFWDKVPNQRPYDVLKWQANTTVISSLGWEPKHTLKTGLKKVYEYIKTQTAGFGN